MHIKTSGSSGLDMIRLPDDMEIEHLRHLPTNPTLQMSRYVYQLNNCLGEKNKDFGMCTQTTR